MKIKFYIVTYNRREDLHRTLASLFNTDIDDYNVELHIVNNHSNFQLLDYYKPNGEQREIRVLHNVLRPNFSCGHLSRNYNEILIHGFKDLNNPQCDLLIHSHDDNEFDPNLFKKLIEYHNQGLDLITYSLGCGFMSYKPEAVKKIGMWDERFCTIGYHEGDYFLRAIKYNREHISINDWEAARRLYNNTPEQLCKKLPDTGQNESHQASFKYYSICRRLWEKKWGYKLTDVGWSGEQLENIEGPLISMYMFYPYFEKGIENIEQKYYTDIDINGKQFF